MKSLYIKFKISRLRKKINTLIRLANKTRHDSLVRSDILKVVTFKTQEQTVLIEQLKGGM